VLSQQCHQQVVGSLVTGVLELAADEPALSHLEQPLTGCRCQPRRQSMVVGCERAIVVGHGTER
jgi:hypothetical protein